MDELDHLKQLAGITNSPAAAIENISYTAAEKTAYMKKHDIRPGTDEWFKLWFAKPYLTGEDPMPRK